MRSNHESLEWWSRHSNPKGFRYGLNRIDRSYYNEIVETYDVRSMLDLGCGFGDTRSVIDRDLTYVGLDYTMQFLSAGMVRGRAERVPFPDRSFDMVTCRALLEHVLNPDPIIEEMVRVTKSLIAVVWFLVPGSGESLRYDRRGFWNNRHDRDRVMKAFEPYTVTETMRESRHTCWVLQSS